MFAVNINRELYSAEITHVPVNCLAQILRNWPFLKNWLKFPSYWISQSVAMISGCWPGSRAMPFHFLLVVPAVLGQYGDLDPVGYPSATQIALQLVYLPG